MTSTTAHIIATITLTPGDWDVSGGVDFSPSGPTVTSAISAGLSLTSSFLGGRGAYQSILVNPVAGQYHSLTAGVLRVKATVATNVFLLAQSNFASGGQLANGFMAARRVGH